MTEMESIAEEEEDFVGPVGPAPPRKKRKVGKQALDLQLYGPVFAGLAVADHQAGLRLQVLQHEQAFLEALPCAEMYEKSYMHRDVVTQVAVAQATDFIITGSRDGHLKFWRKKPVGIVFVKHFRAHKGAIDGEPAANSSSARAVFETWARSQGQGAALPSSCAPHLISGACMARLGVYRVVAIVWRPTPLLIGTLNRGFHRIARHKHGHQVATAHCR
jgi:hypothetical protein